MKKSGILFIILIIFLSACKHDKLDVDISGVETKPLEVLRFEKDFFALNANNVVAKTQELETKYGAFYQHYLMGFLNRNGSKDSAYKTAVLSFVNDKDVKEAFNYERKLYPVAAIDKISDDLNDCVMRFKYHFPDKKLPAKFITCQSGWNYAFAYMDSALVLSLDMYLNDSAKFYQMLRYPAYQTRKMNNYHILPDMARGWLLTEFDNSDAENTLLHHTIFYGKLFYAVKALLPTTHDSLIIGYDTKQMQYCKSYEKNLWGYFAEKKRLYESNLNTVRELTTDGPFSGAISKECPPRIAMWVGWQIVKSYMNNNDKVTLAQLMAEKDAQKILNKSKYRP